MKLQKKSGSLAARLLTVAFAASALAATTTAYAQENIRATVDGNLVAFSDVQPMMVNNRVMVPVRGVFEYMKADVTWDAVNQRVVAHRGEDHIVLPVNSRTATVNGKEVQLENPAIITRGRTMVPLRFLSETMHATVTWLESTRMVVIDSNGPGANPEGNAPSGYNTMLLESGTVLPFRMNDSLSSKDSRVGDKFKATLDTRDYPNYQGLSEGAILEGHVDVVSPKTKEAPGVLGLAFDRIRTRDGRSYSVDGTLIGLDSKSILNDNGRLTATPAGKKDNLKYVGYGAGAGALIAIITKSNFISTTLIGSALGFLYGEIQKDSSKSRDVMLKEDTMFGVRLTDRLAFYVPANNPN